MKSLFAFLGIAGAMNFASAAETACVDSDCVVKKNEAMAAAFNFLYNEDRCVSEKTWIQGIHKTGDLNFDAICGDAKKNVTLKLKLTEPAPSEGTDGEYFVEIVN
jgi:hypothetical protein